MAFSGGQLDAVLLACLSNDNNTRLQVIPPPSTLHRQPGFQGSAFMPGNLMLLSKPDLFGMDIARNLLNMIVKCHVLQCFLRFGIAYRGVCELPTATWPSHHHIFTVSVTSLQAHPLYYYTPCAATAFTTDLTFCWHSTPFVHVHSLPPLPMCESMLAVQPATCLQAEETVKAAAKHPALVGQLLERLGAAADPQVRQLAAVLLRKRVTSAWQHLEPSVRRRQTASKSGWPVMRVLRKFLGYPHFGTALARSITEWRRPLILAQFRVPGMAMGSQQLPCTTLHHNSKTR